MVGSYIPKQEGRGRGRETPTTMIKATIIPSSLSTLTGSGRSERTDHPLADPLGRSGHERDAACQRHFWRQMKREKEEGSREKGENFFSKGKVMSERTSGAQSLISIHFNLRSKENKETNPCFFALQSSGLASP